MGGKPQHAIPSNRPESGGADKDDLKEKSGLLERSKQEFAAADQKKRQMQNEKGDHTASDGTAADAPQPHAVQALRLCAGRRRHGAEDTKLTIAR